MMYLNIKWRGIFQLKNYDNGLLHMWQYTMRKTDTVLWICPLDSKMPMSETRRKFGKTRHTLE